AQAIAHRGGRPNGQGVADRVHPGGAGAAVPGDHRYDHHPAAPGPGVDRVQASLMASIMTGKFSFSPYIAYSRWRTHPERLRDLARRRRSNPTPRAGATARTDGKV